MDEDGNCKQQLRYLKRKMVWLIFSEKNSFVNFLPHLSTVPKAIRPDTKSTVCLRLTYHRTEGQEPTFHPLSYLDHLWKWEDRYEKHDGSPVGEHGHSGGGPVKSKLCSAFDWTPSVPDKSLEKWKLKVGDPDVLLTRAQKISWIWKYGTLKCSHIILETQCLPGGTRVRKREPGCTSASCKHAAEADRSHLWNPRVQNSNLPIWLRVRRERQNRKLLV